MIGCGPSGASGASPLIVCTRSGRHAVRQPDQPHTITPPTPARPDQPHTITPPTPARPDRPHSSRRPRDPTTAPATAGPSGYVAPGPSGLTPRRPPYGGAFPHVHALACAYMPKHVDRHEHPRPLAPGGPDDRCPRLSRSEPRRQTPRTTSRSRPNAPWNVNSDRSWDAAKDGEDPKGPSPQGKSAHAAVAVRRHHVDGRQLHRLAERRRVDDLAATHVQGDVP